MTNIQFDTNRYEGHTPERWTVDEEDPYRVVDVQECTIARTDFVDIDEERGWQLANAQLIADAPEILQALVDEQEKVKHLLSIEKVQEMMTAYGRDLNREIDVLRECIADIANNMEAADDSYMSGFIEDLRKAMKK